MPFLSDLRSLDAKASPAPIELAILDTPLADIGAYVHKCVHMGPSPHFYFASGKHPDGGGGDVCHFGNGPTSLSNGQLLVLLRNHAARIAAVVEAAGALLACDEAYDKDRDWSKVEEDRASAMLALASTLAALEAP